MKIWHMIVSIAAASRLIAENRTAQRFASPDLLPNRGGFFVYRRAAISAIREYRYTVLETFAWASRLISTSTHGLTCQG
jgi:hypothetical protein